jgi:hypothetical protein
MKEITRGQINKLLPNKRLSVNPRLAIIEQLQTVDVIIHLCCGEMFAGRIFSGLQLCWNLNPVEVMWNLLKGILRTEIFALFL